jgi:UDP-glucuronate 4-epimerase
MLFAKAILAGEPIRVFNHGQMRRDFTYIDDIVEGVIRCLDKPATADPQASMPPPPIRPPAGRRTGCSTSATPSRKSCSRSLPCWSRPWAARRSGSSSRCSPATWRPPPPTLGGLSAIATPLAEGVERFAAWYRDRYG